MVEMLAATWTLPDAPLALAGVTLELAPPAQRLSLRARDAELLGRETGLPLPARIGDFSNGVAKLGPDEWLAVLPLNPPPLGEVAAHRADAGGTLQGDVSPGGTRSVSLREPPPPGGEDFLLPVSIVDVSSRAIGIIVEGPNAAALIGAGCPLDLARMAPGRATRTLFETVEIILIRTSETRFHIEVWRSFAPWLFGALSAASPG